MCERELSDGQPDKIDEVAGYEELPLEILLDVKKMKEEQLKECILESEKISNELGLIDVVKKNFLDKLLNHFIGENPFNLKKWQFGIDVHATEIAFSMKLSMFSPDDLLQCSDDDFSFSKNDMGPLFDKLNSGSLKNVSTNYKYMSKASLDVFTATFSVSKKSYEKFLKSPVDETVDGVNDDLKDAL